MKVNTYINKYSLADDDNNNNNNIRETCWWALWLGPVKKQQQKNTQNTLATSKQ